MKLFLQIIAGLILAFIFYIIMYAAAWLDSFNYQ